MSRNNFTIGWIRHGSTEWNSLGKIQGTTDIPLNDEGILQARQLASRLASEQRKWNGVVCSDLARAVQTAEILAEKLGLPVIRDSRLRERHFGSAEGTTHEERLARWGENWRKLVPDQESDESVLARGMSFLREWEDNHPGEAWLAVSHGSFITRMLDAMAPHLEDKYILNVSLTILEKQQHKWIPLLHNCTAHLADLAKHAHTPNGQRPF
jgi:probable phosphoglycerate mutase